MSYEPATCLIPNCDGAGHPDECTRLLTETTIAEQLEVSTELVASDRGPHVSVLATGLHIDEALIVRCRTRGELLALATQFADTAAMLAQAADELPDAGVCAQCEQVWPVEDLGRDDNGDVVCRDCASSDPSADDAAAFRAYAYSGR